MRLTEFIPGGEPRDAVPITLMSKIFLAAARWKEGATMDDLGYRLVIIHGDYIEPAETPHFAVEGRLCIPMQRNQRLRAGYADAWVSIGVTPTGEFRYAPMRDADLTDAPEDLPNASLPGASDVVHWLSTGERGTSSEAMCRRLYGVPRIESRDAAANPRDIADLRRCILFLDAVPAARSKMQELSAMSPVWSLLIENWNELESLYRKDERAAANRKLSELIERALDPATTA